MYKAKVAAFFLRSLQNTQREANTIQNFWMLNVVGQVRKETAVSRKSVVPHSTSCSYISYIKYHVMKLSKCSALRCFLWHGQKQQLLSQIRDIYSHTDEDIQFLVHDAV